MLKFNSAKLMTFILLKAVKSTKKLIFLNYIKSIFT